MLFDESDSSLNSNDNSFLSNSSDAQSSSNGRKAAKHRNVVNHFYLPERLRPRPKRAESVKDVLEELISQKTENSLKLTNRNNSNIKSVHFTSPLAMQQQQQQQQQPSSPNTPLHKPSSTTETNFLKPSLAKAKYTHTPLVKTDVVRTSSLRYANPSSLKLYFSNQNSTTGRLDESKSLENLKDHETGSPNTHTINRLVKMASSWSVKSRASSTSSNYVDPNLVSQLKIKQTHMFLSDENDYATIESCLSRQLGKTSLVDQAENKWTSGVVKGKKFQPFDTSSKRSSVVDDADFVLPKMQPRFNSQKMNFAKQRLTRSFRLVNLNRNLCADKKPVLIKDHRILNQDKQLIIPIK